MADTKKVVAATVFVIVAASLTSVVGCTDPTGLGRMPVETAYADVFQAADALSTALADLTWTEHGEQGTGGAVFLISGLRALESFVPSTEEPNEGTYFAFMRRLETERARLERLRNGASPSMEPLLATLATTLQSLRSRVIQDIAPAVAALVESEGEVRRPFEVGITLAAFGGSPLRTAETFPIAVVGTVEVVGDCYDDQGQIVSGVTLHIRDAIDRSVLATGDPAATFELDEPTRVTLGVEADGATAVALDACQLSFAATRPALSARPLTPEQDGALQQQLQDFRGLLGAKQDTVRLHISGADDLASRDLYAELGARLQGSDRLVDMLGVVSVLGEISPDDEEIAKKDHEMTEEEMDELLEELKKGYDDAREQMEEAQKTLQEVAENQSETTRTITDP